jgi:hypothetical protein
LELTGTSAFLGARNESLPWNTVTPLPSYAGKDRLLQHDRPSGYIVNFSRKSFFDVDQNRFIVRFQYGGVSACLIDVWRADELLLRMGRCVQFGLNTIPIIIAHVSPSALNFSTENTAIGPRM